MEQLRALGERHRVRVRAPTKVGGLISPMRLLTRRSVGGSRGLAEGGAQREALPSVSGGSVSRSVQKHNAD